MDSKSGKIMSLPNEWFLKEVKTLLDKGQQVRIPVKGRSMRPFLQDGDTVVLAPINDRSVRWGKIVLARTDLCGTVLHRVVLINKGIIWLMGDAHFRQREQTATQAVLAVVVAASRNGKDLKLNSFGWHCATLIWFLLLPFRGWLLRSYDRLNRKN
jgi:hypothetical protein